VAATCSAKVAAASSHGKLQLGGDEGIGYVTVSHGNHKKRSLCDNNICSIALQGGKQSQQ